MKYERHDIIRELVKRKADTSALTEEEVSGDRIYKWRDDLFNYQLEFIDDPCKTKTALCSRRAGKTYASCYYLLEAAHQSPHTICAYIALTRRSAKRLMWRELKMADKKYMLGIKFNASELIAILPNGSQIIMSGADDEAEIDKLRGSAYQLVVIDEAASFGPHLTSLIEEVLEPALIDYDGTLAMIGTPASHCSGIFFEATTGLRDEYSNHSWTILENPHVPHAGEWLADRRKKRGWSDTSPVYMREWRGQWVKSDDSLIYKYGEKNLADTLSHDHDWEYVLGVDLGYEDATAFVVGAFCRDLPDLYIVDSFKKSHMLPTEIAEEIRSMENTYKFIGMVADTGGLGKSIVEEFRKRHGLPLKAAEKRNKVTYIEMMNDDLATGKLKIIDREILKEWDILQWDDSGKREDGRFDNHLSDAALYMWRESRHYTFQEEVDTTPEGWSKEERRMWDSTLAKSSAKEGPWWEDRWTLN